MLRPCGRLTPFWHVLQLPSDVEPSPPPTYATVTVTAMRTGTEATVSRAVEPPD
jgi:hypothetical protein